MDVILLQDVESLGGKGALVSVARGYARNFLIPQKLAEVATPGKIIEFQRREEERKARDARLAAQADEHTETLNKTVLTLSAKVGEGDRLFGSITAVDVADAIKAARGFAIDKRKVRLEEPIKEVGTFMVEVEVGDGFVATVKVIVTPE
jgi:large subunit ribosomal protein L9